MTVQELGQVIQEYIMDIYNSKYIGKIWINKLNPIGYEIKFGMNTPECPDIIYAELEDKAFLKFLKEELKHRCFNTIHYGKLQKIMPSECINKSCSCNDK